MGPVRKVITVWLVLLLVQLVHLGPTWTVSKVYLRAIARIVLKVTSARSMEQSKLHLSVVKGITALKDRVPTNRLNINVLKVSSTILILNVGVVQHIKNHSLILLYFVQKCFGSIVSIFCEAV